MRTHGSYFRPLARAMAAALISCTALAGATPEATKKFYGDDPLWSGPRPEPVKMAARRKLNDYYDFFENTLFAPGERAALKGESIPAQGINTVDEVPDTAWYTNRHAMRRMSREELQRGPGDSHPPETGQWTVIAAKDEGVTPGFRIRDAAGREYFIKFDPPSNPEMASAADTISSRFFHAIGYNVPENYVIYFDREQLVPGAGSTIKDHAGKKRPIRAGDITELLAKAPRSPEGRYRALASRVIGGKLLGPFEYNGTRSDDPNDLVPHEHRRDLRALRTFSAWLGHDDSKALNTQDTLVEENGVAFVKHYLIDFGASLGSASFEAASPREGNEYLFAWKPAALRLFTLGLYVPGWQQAKFPRIAAAGRFEYEVFDPERWVNNYPNAAFRNETAADRAWAARKIAAFTDDDIRAIVARGRYSDPAAAEWVTRCLIERRNKIARAFLKGTACLDGFEVREKRLRYSNPERTAVRVAWSIFDNRTSERTPIAGADSLEIPAPDGAQYVVANFTGMGPRLSIYIKQAPAGSRIVGIERDFSTQGE